MGERSYVSEFLPFSAPVEEIWLRKVVDAPKTYIIGEGVTAQEYSHILRRLRCSFESVSSKQAIDNPLLLSDGYMIVACYKARKNVTRALEAAKFIRGVHFDLFFQLLRNRAVFDFRGLFDFSEEGWLEAISYIKSYSTLGGIDIFVDQDGVTRLSVSVAESLRALCRDFHVKLSIDVNGQFDSHVVGNFEVDLIELLVREKGRAYFDPDAFDKVCKNASFSQAHIVYIACDEPISGENFSSEVQSHHPAYYDEMLPADSVVSTVLKRKGSDFCLSRRMYPVFDKKLNLKLCSLYDSAARTAIPCLDKKVGNYAERRNALCLQCRQAGLYRKL